MRVAFRVDASIRIGTGHVMRCLTLANQLSQQGHQCSFICRDLEGNLGNLISASGFKVSLLRGDPVPESSLEGVEHNAHAGWLTVPWQRDAQQTYEVLRRHETDWLVVDHYALDARWERAIAPGVGRILVIDDIADRPHMCNALLDQNLGRQRSDYEGLVPQDALRLIGPHYALLRPEFRQLREKSLQRRHSAELKRILISLGGVDRTNVTGKVLDALTETGLRPDVELDIIMGASAPALAEVQAQLETLRFQATVSVNVSDMAERMYQADLSIGAAGSTSWERCCLGLPAIMIILADNQRLIGKALARADAALLVGEDHVQDDLGPCLRRFVESGLDLRAFSRNAAEICDGGGTARLVSVMTGSGVA